MSQAAVTTTPARQGIRPQKLAHVVLRTHERFEQMTEWYRDLLSADIVHKDESLCLMTYDEEHHRLALANFAGLTDRPSGTVGLEHIAFTYANLSDLFETYARLKEQGTEPILAINHGATTSLYYQDPDRNRLELQVDTFDTLAEVEEFLASGALAVNPIGVPFDAEDWLARVRAGESKRQLTSYPVPPPPVEPWVWQTLHSN